MGRLTKDAWKESSLRTKEVEVEELGGSVLIRELPASVSSDLEGLIDLVQVGREQRAKVDVGTIERRQFAYGVIDDNGEPLFTEEEAGELHQKHGRAFKFVVRAIDELSGIDKKSLEEAEARFPVSGEGSANGRSAESVASGDDEPAVSARAGG